MPILTQGGRWEERRTCVIIPLDGKEETTPSISTEGDLWRSALNATVSFVELCLHVLH